MSDILFRGKGTEGEDKGKWVYGVPVTTSGGDCYIIEGVMDYDAIGYDVKMTRVNSDTVGQRIDTTDRNGKEIYEGDIMRYKWDGKERVDKIVYEPPHFTLSNSFRWSLDQDEVIGNIYDNPELLEEAQT